MGDRGVRRLGFGALRITGPGGYGPPRDVAAACDVLREVAPAVDFIDTADCYGPSVSETLIAHALHPYRDGLVIATKGGMTCTSRGEWIPNGDPDRLRRCCEGSLTRLRLDCIELYQLHGVDPRVGLEPAVEVLAALQSDGLIRHIGLCNVTAKQLREALRIVAIAAVQNRFSWACRESQPVVDEAKRVGIPFIAWFPLERGRLSGGDAGALSEVATALGATMAQVAIAWLLHRSPNILPIPGTGSISHLRELLAAADVVLDDAAIACLEQEARQFVTEDGATPSGTEA